MVVAIASVRAPKVNGITQAIRDLAVRFPAALPSDLTIEKFEVESGVSHTPNSIDELLKGAEGRALRLHARITSEMGGPCIAVGAEGGLWSRNGSTFLQSWVCAWDGLRKSFGASGAIEIPKALANAVLVEGKDLGVVIDAFASEHDIRSRQGTWGILTCDLVSREDSFRLAATTALMPLLNVELYARDLGGSGRHS